MSRREYDHHTDFKFHPRITQIGCYWGGGGHTELYLVEGDRLAIIDTGVSETPDEYIRPALAAIGRDLGEIEVIINTHGHHDHAGGNRAVHDAAHCEIWIHENDAALTQDPDFAFDTFFARDMRLLDQAARIDEARVKHRQTAGRAAPLTRRFRDGDRLDLGAGIVLRVVHAPGHTLGCCVFVWEREGIAISGDSALGRGSRVGGLPLIFYPDAYRESLATIRRIQPRVLCLGHHYRTLRQTNASIRYGDAISAFLAESAEIQDLIDAAMATAVAELGRDVPFARVARRALRRLADDMPLVDEANGWPNGAISALSAPWSQATGQAV